MLNLLLTLLAFALCTVGQTDISNLAGPFYLITTKTTDLPIYPTAYLALYCEVIIN